MVTGVFDTRQKDCICIICAPFFDKKKCHTFMVFLCICAGSAGYGIAALYKTAHCGAAIKVRRTRWEKCVTHYAMFSSAAVVHLLHSF